jgi:hypothetical protein
MDETEVVEREDAAEATPDPVLDHARDTFPATEGWLRVADLVGLTVIIAAGLVLRFATRSPMWLDEALTVSIAKQPLGHIAGALRHDGHPPLYYYLLHGWMSVFGQSDMAIRALSGVFGVLLIPLVWLATRRAAGRSAAWTAVVVLSVLPFALRYSTENRMYSMVMVLAVVGWLLVQSALERPRPLVLAGVALCTTALLWSHYWAMWLGAATALCLLVRWVHRRHAGRSEEARSTLLVLGALAAGAVLFLPWVPTLLYQTKHTGTPWGHRAMPTTVAAISVQDLAGGGKGDQILFGWLVVIIALIGIFGASRDAVHIDLDLRGRAAGRPFAIIIVTTLAIASVMLVITNSAFQSRYNAVWVPFAVILAGIGISQLWGRAAQRGVMAILVVLAAPSMVRNVRTPRTQAREAAQAIAAVGHPGDIVAVCPDQLGPGLVRELKPGFVVGPYPNFDHDPSIVDWVDYTARLAKANPQTFANDLLRRAGSSHQIFLVWSGNYTTHPLVCEQIAHDLEAVRPGVHELVGADDTIYENEAVLQYAAPVPRK